MEYYNAVPNQELFTDIRGQEKRFISSSPGAMFCRLLLLYCNDARNQAKVFHYKMQNLRACKTLKDIMKPGLALWKVVFTIKCKCAVNSYVNVIRNLSRRFKNAGIFREASYHQQQLYNKQDTSPGYWEIVESVQPATIELIAFENLLERIYLESTLQPLFN